MSSPHGGDIYWGKTESEMVKTNRQTISSRSMIGKQWESWCYQVVKAGYLPSEIICRPDGEEYRRITFKLTKINTYITSEPPNAEVYWGFSKYNLQKTNYITPWTEDSADTGANYKDWFFQVRKKGYNDSEIIFMPCTQKHREIHFILDPVED